MAGSRHSSPLGALTVPSFAARQARLVHFFGTRQEPRVLQSIASPGAVVPGPFPFAAIASLRQVHGQTVVVLDRPIDRSPVSLDPGDALVTNQPNLVLTVRTADCVPVLMADRRGRAIAAIHAGWRGSVGGIVAKTIGLLSQRFGCAPADLEVAIGPSIGGCCYEVDEAVLGPLRARFEWWTDVVSPCTTGKAVLDLHAVLVRQLYERGVSPSAIGRVARCTRCEPDLFYSYRRDGPGYSTMLSGIMLTDRSAPKNNVTGEACDLPIPQRGRFDGSPHCNR